MTALIIIAFAVICVAATTKFVLMRPWRARGKLFVLFFSLIPLPATAWWLAFNSLGSGWGFGLIAIALSAIFSFGASMGWLWHVETRPL